MFGTLANMHRAFIVLLLSFGATLGAELWPGVPFTEVRAFSWPGDLKSDKVILEGMALRAGVINNNGAILSPKQVERLRNALVGQHPELPGIPEFFPQNAFVFYDASKKPVAYVEICFPLLNCRAKPMIDTPNHDYLTFAKIFQELKLPLGAYPDLDAFVNSHGQLLKAQPQ